MSRFGKEDNTTEFKRQLNDALEKEVVAFLNSAKGGDLYIGVDDDGEAVGVTDADALMLAISDRIRHNILPSCLGLYDVYKEEHDGKTIIHVMVTRGTEKPYYLKRYGQSPAGCFIRVGSGIQPMTTAMIDQLYAGRVRNSLRNIPAPTTLNLSFQQLKIYYQEKGFEINDAFLHNLDLYTPEGRQFNYAAYLLADTNSISIKVAKYAGKDKCDLIENEEYGYCSLVKATHRVLEKLNIENKTLTRITGAAERKQHRLINERALREALINAIIHNDYSAEVPPLVEIYADRVSITSYGGLVSGLSLAECLAGRSMPRNRELMRVFRDLDLVEHLGSGIHRILSAYDSSIFHISEHFFEICFPLPAIESIETVQAKSVAESGAESESLAESVAESESLAESVAESESLAESGAESGAESFIYKILFLLQDGPLSKSELALKLGLNNVTGTLNRSVNAMLDDVRIERTLPDKPKSRLQKYRLTQTGREWLEHNEARKSEKQTVGEGRNE